MSGIISNLNQAVINCSGNAWNSGIEWERFSWKIFRRREARRSKQKGHKKSSKISTIFISKRILINYSRLTHENLHIYCDITSEQTNSMWVHSARHEWRIRRYLLNIRASKTRFLDSTWFSHTLRAMSRRSSSSGSRLEAKPAASDFFVIFFYF